MEEKIGPTGKYPKGKLRNDDSGEITLAIGTKDGKMVIDFGVPVRWIGMDPEEALALAQKIIEKALEAKRERDSEIQGG